VTSRFEDLERAFHPRSVAIVGVPRSEANHPPGYTGYTFLRLLQQAGFEGRIYPVNPNADVIQGLKAYPAVSALPERVDLVIVAVPVAAVASVLRDCVKAGAVNVQIATAGFSETGEEKGREAEQEVQDIAIGGGLQVAGPNCLGYHVPAARMQMYDKITLLQGPVAFLSQSGGHGQGFARMGPTMGVGFSKIISYGNALLLDCTDFLEYLAQDAETEIICMYLEGVKDGRKLARLVKDIVPRKPIIVWKGGLTSSGARATATHTSSMAGNRQMWEAFFKQTGALSVGSIDEMSDLSMTFLKVKPFAGTGVAVFGGGGGNNVATADTCAEEGLDLPPPSPQTRARLLEFTTLVNQSIVNPMDAGSLFASTALLQRALDAVCAEPQVQVVILHMGADYAKWLSQQALAEFKSFIVEYNRSSPAGKPVIVAIQEQEKAAESAEFVRDLRQSGITTYSSLRRAARALRRFSSYHKYLDSRSC
jgi:acyl-CoA synthetase (NDP forming)